MKFNEIMHLSFYTDQMDEMRDFYENTKITKNYALALRSSKLNMIKNKLIFTW